MSAAQFSAGAQEAAPAVAPRYEKPVAETLPPLEGALAALKKRAPAVGEKRIVNGRARFLFDGKMTAPVFTVTPYWNPEAAHVADFREAGVRVYAVPLWLGRMISGTRGVWTGKNTYDFSSVDAALLRVLRVDPQAQIILYLNVNPYQSWGAENPDDVTQDQNGKRPAAFVHANHWGEPPTVSEFYGPSPVSGKMRHDTANALRALVDYLREKSVAGKAVAGFHLVGLNDGQFLPWDESWPVPHLGDYSPAARAAFRDWLRRRYVSEKALRVAWHSAEVTFQNAEVPSGARRLAPGFLLAPRDTDITDFNRFYTEGIVETVLGYARVLKAATGGKKLVGTYYPDAASGIISHLALARVLASPDIDYLVAPAKYGIRLPGQPSATGMLLDSIALHGKIYLQEQDWRSWLSESIGKGGDAFVGRVENAADHRAIVQRDSGMMLAHEAGTWFYDMDGGWFANADIMRGVANARAAFETSLRSAASTRTAAPDGTDVAVFVSENSADFLTEAARATALRVGVVQSIEAFNSSGVPYRLYLQSDMANPKLPRFKTYVFLNAYSFSAAERAALEKLKSGNRTLVFAGASGVADSENGGAEIEKISGIRVAKLGENIPLKLKSLASTRAPFSGLELTGSETMNGPAYRVNDGNALHLGVYSSGEIGAVRRDFGSWKSIFFGGVGLSADFLHALARESGAWIVAPAGDAIYANARFLTIHAMRDGEKNLALCEYSRVVDLNDGKLIAAKTRALHFPMKRGETRWFSLTPTAK